MSSVMRWRRGVIDGSFVEREKRQSATGSFPQSRPSEKKAASGSSSPETHHHDRQRRITAERSSPMSFIQ